MSSRIVVFLQSSDGTFNQADQAVVVAALQLKQAWGLADVVGLSLGSNAQAAAQAAAQAGFSEIVWSSAPHLEHYTALHYAAALQQVAQELQVSAVVTAASSLGKDLMPRVAYYLKAGQASDIVAVHPDGSLRRPMYAGDILADVVIETPVKVVTVRTSAFGSLQAGSVQTAPLRELTLKPYSGNASLEYVSSQSSKSERPELTSAAIVVSGGRAMQSAENFEKYLFPLADQLGAAVGASRAAVDSGFAPNDWQVGQTGKIVAPEVYIAVGISGAIQHLAGMKDSKVIVAINKDSEAPIFEIADYGLVADLFQALPELTAELKKAKNS
jgi:electron transfer flavoprotein alpha subunit